MPGAPFARIGEWNKIKRACKPDRSGYAFEIVNGGRSSVGRAPDCDSGGRGFEPHRPPQFKAPMIPGGSWTHRGPLAQLAEQ